jgi:hypothetical protein
MKALKYLRKREWSMGNGQCPECCGVHEGWLGHLLYKTSKNIGHKKKCKLAKAIKSLGGEVLYEGKSKLMDEYETFISEQGIFGTRLKTKDGCPRVKEYNEKFNAQIREIMNKVIEGVYDGNHISG